jgi:acyl-homoserine lactone acylase PvdQ
MTRENIHVTLALQLFFSRRPLVLFNGMLGVASPQKGTEILWDKFGVAHVYAKSVEDMFYCYGYAQAQSHGDLLLHVYGESRGRAAEISAPLVLRTIGGSGPTPSRRGP